MPPAAPQQQQGDTSLTPFWIIIGIFVAAWAVWYFAHEQIAHVILQLRMYEAKFISWFVPAAGIEVQVIKNTDPASVSFNDLANISTLVGNYLRYPIAAILGLLAIAIYLTNPNLRFKKTYTMHRLVEEEKVNWPQITPVASLNLVETDIDSGPWAMAMSPMQFAKKYQLLQEERLVSSGTTYEQPGKVTVSLRREEAYRVFSMQLGRYWHSVERLSPHAKALFAIFAARANRDGPSASKLLLQIAASSKEGKLDFTGAEELLNKHKDSKAVVKVTKSHAFILTVMASMLVLARTDGVLASAEFLWLKPVDRSLWFMLNTVGRQTPFTEVGGAYAHWLAERKAGRKLSIPMVEEAVNALELALKEIIYIPDEEL